MPERFVTRPDGKHSSIIHDVVVNFNYDILGAKTDNWIFIADTNYEVVGVQAKPTIAGTDGGAVTAAVKKASGTTAVGSGTAVHSGTLDLKGTANTLQTATLAASKADRELVSGDSLGIDFTGVLTTAEGFIQVRLKRIQGAGGVR